MSDKPRVLVVGAGAVGQVYARHAQLGGADVTFFVRDKYREQVARGLTMYPLNRRRKRRGEPVRFEGFGVVSRADEVAADRFNQVYLTVSSPALRGPWLGELMAATGDATIVALQPGREDRDTIVAAGVPIERVVLGMIALISYVAPLPGETRFPEPGMAYWFPPMSKAPFSGAPERTAAVVALMRRGKLPAKRHADVPHAVAFPSAIMMAYLVALENAGWSLRPSCASRSGSAPAARARQSRSSPTARARPRSARRSWRGRASSAPACGSRGASSRYRSRST